MQRLSFVKSKRVRSESRGKGLVIRFWGCNLECPLCFAQSYAYRDKEGRRAEKCSLHDLQKDIAQKFSNKLQWLRIEGGEPLLSRLHAEFLHKIVKWIINVANSAFLSPVTIVIQTNGIWLGGNLNNAKFFYEGLYSSLCSTKIKSRVAVEISFKGPNEEAYSIYSGSEGGFKTQCNAFEYSIKILEKFWKEGVKGLAVYPVAGFGPSFEVPKDLILIPIDPSFEVPLFHKSSWDSRFSEIVNEFQNVLDHYKSIYEQYIKRHGKRIQMYGLELRFRKWQTAWVKRVLKDEKLRKLVQKCIRLNKDNFQYAGFYKKDLQKLELPEADEALLEKVQQLGDDFVELSPKDHYPFL